PRVYLRLVDGGAGLGDPEPIDHAGVLHAAVLVAAAGRVIEPGPGEQAAVPVVRGGDVVHPPVRRRLPLLDGLGIGAAVVDGRTGQGADGLADHVRPAYYGLRRLEHGLLHAVLALHRGVVVFGEHVLL